ncbi:MAG: hypothetical protein OEZ39_20175 [Gammaproteobacteria bacterium]|nr:hypothetical protein [Gammaproteobacteria bacterium]
MLIKLVVAGVVHEIKKEDYDLESDDVRSILTDICVSISESTSAHFLVSGFGEERWPVDIKTDLPVLLEQLPDACCALKKQTEPFCLDFYEQGIERALNFEPINGAYKIYCKSQTNWLPNPEYEYISTDELIEIISDLRGVFLSAIPDKSNLLSHPWLQEWQEQTLLR